MTDDAHMITISELFDAKARIEELEARMDGREIIAYIAREAARFGAAAEVGGMEMAGAIVSHLAKNPENIEPFLNGGILELPADLWMHGNLTWHGGGGTVVNAETVRRAKQVKRLGELGSQLNASKGTDDDG
ncbi:MAG: hypothetical protein HRU18_25805 [Pseudoalteromonas sp.]|uniref:hypothetical protein n=1 Tax=Pseudoalteromonas sp. TaxID=53249 RepID=UPI001D7F467A|nr:hypothetical protein [Pseudoalteromonas sp.]NRA81628.1 hypothetical protein [Pseudoalteromonas sp.]